MEEESDGLDSFSLEQIGQRTGAFGGARLLKYVTDHYVTREGEVIEPSREMIVLGLKKVVQKFVAQKLVDTIVVPDNEKMPDVAAMNEAAPREEWGTDLNGNPVGPYVRVLVLKMLDANTMDRFAFVTSSVGGSIAVGDLSDKTKVMRRLNGANVTPVVSCSITNFKTRFSLKSVREHQAGLQSFRSMRRIDARRKNASALRLRFSQSLASLRQRLSQAMVRSTTQRRGSTTNPLA